MASRSSRARTVVPFTPPRPAPASAPSPPGVCVGVVAGFDGERVTVDSGNAGGPVVARLLAGLDAAALAAAASSRQAVGLPRVPMRRLSVMALRDNVRTGLLRRAVLYSPNRRQFDGAGARAPTR